MFSVGDKKTIYGNLSLNKKHLTFYGKQYIITIMKMQGEIFAFFEKIFGEITRRSNPMMEYQSTRNPELHATAAQAVLQGLAPDGGLYTMPSLAQVKLDWQAV